MQTFAINTDNDRPLKSEHVAFFSEGGERDITLFEVVRNTYPHPDAPKEATISVLEIIRLFTERKGSEKSAPAELVGFADANALAIKSRYYNA